LGELSAVTSFGSNVRLDFGDRHSLLVVCELSVLYLRMNFKGLILVRRLSLGEQGKDVADWSLGLFLLRIKNFLGMLVSVGTLPRGLLVALFGTFLERIKFSTVAFSEFDRGLPNSS